MLDRTYDLLRSTTGAASPARIKSFLSARRTFILCQIKNPAAFAIETNGGEPFTTVEAAAALSGKAPFEVVEILAGGAPAAVRWITRETWELDVPLAPGENVIELHALNRALEPVGSASIRITRDSRDGGFIRGDANGDFKVDISDAVKTLRYLFSGDEIGCADAADIDDSGVVQITDPIVLLDHLFRGGSAPPPPFPDAGPDPTPDALGCP
ncbi:MAG: hypothetical protein HY721_17950 [Planctomycetes bacterium]|nr:hypothetical protein [Planctomycetota bacterium]